MCKQAKRIYACGHIVGRYGLNTPVRKCMYAILKQKTCSPYETDWAKSKIEHMQCYSCIVDATGLT